MDRPRLLSLVVSLLVYPAAALVQKHDVGKLPALGWNSWNAFHCNVSEANLLIAATQMKKTGLQAAGYVYVNSDDCWASNQPRDSKTQRIIPDPDKFPDGISGTASKLHAMGFKMGIYSTAGTETCAGYPASLGYEDVDAEAFADWDIDYLKYDNCNVPSDWADKYDACVPDNPSVSTRANNGSCGGTDPYLPPKGFDWKTSKTHERYVRMRDALLKQNRTILYSLCEWGNAGVLSWGNSTGNSWRTTGDISPDWDRIATILNENSFYTHYTDFWGHSDPDMLEVGNGDLTPAETRTHFSLWAAMKSPLLIGTDLSKLSDANIAILKNKYLLAFHQDPVHGKSAAPFRWGVNPDWTFDPEHPAEYWAGDFSGGTMLWMMNTNYGMQTRSIAWDEVPGVKGRIGKGKKNGFRVTNAWTGKDLGCVKSGVEMDVQAHDTAVLVVGEAC